MDVIAKLADIDPVFREVAATLYPEFDPRELHQLAKSMPDTSAVHATNSGQQKSSSGKKKLAAGLIAGAGIEAAAAGETVGPLKRDIKAFSATRKAEGTLKAIKPFVPHGVGLSRWGSGTKAALMGGNLLVGLGAAKELTKKPKPTPPTQPQNVGKAAPQLIEPTVLAACDDILAARRRGEITTATALELIDRVVPQPVAKARVPRPGAGTLKRILDAGDNMKAIRAMEVARHTDTTGYEWEKTINRGRKVAGVAAFAGAGGLAYKHRSNKLRRSAPFGKRAENPDLVWDGEISKVNDERRQVFGWCSLSTVNGEPVVDLQDDYVPIEEIEKSAYKYVISSRKGGDMHKRVGKGIYAQDEPLHTADLIESVIVTPEKLRAMGVPNDAISKVHTGWWVGFQVNDEDQWQKVKRGERAGFSIHGTGTRTKGGD